MVVCPVGRRTGLTSTSTHEIGTCAALKTVFTASEISGPIPSPGISATYWRLEQSEGFKIVTCRT